MAAETPPRSSEKVAYGTPVAATLGPFGPVLPDANEGADVVALIVAPDLLPGDAHRLVAAGESDGLSLEVPVAWSDGGVGGPWLMGDRSAPERTGVSAFLGPSEDDFYRDSLEASGVFVGASPDLTTPVDDLTREAFELYWRECTIGGRGRWDAGGYAGNYEIYGPCGDEPIRIIGILGRNAVSGATIAIDLHLTTRADLAIAGAVIDSVRYEPPEPGGDRITP